MGVLDASSNVTPLDMKSWLPFAVFTDSERMAEAALAAKTLVAEARAGSSAHAGGAPGGLQASVFAALTV